MTFKEIVKGFVIAILALTFVHALLFIPVSYNTYEDSKNPPQPQILNLEHICRKLIQ